MLGTDQLAILIFIETPMKLRFTTKDENIKPFVCLRHGQMSIKCI
jgi:hypothetical protein